PWKHGRECLRIVPVSWWRAEENPCIRRRILTISFSTRKAPFLAANSVDAGVRELSRSEMVTRKTSHEIVVSMSSKTSLVAWT
ncbi:MAG: hypothetical protein KDM64_11255, partial [Verrucomicrobiae bacterium]|nr:hypothetical protein [Verrucomicrobiae bacterium]